MCKAIKVGLCHVAYVDDADFPLASSFSWSPVVRKRTTYAYANGTDKLLAMHRLITKAPRGLEVDHWNQRGLDNRRQNLRVCTHAENQHNQAKTHGKHRFKGVWWHKATSKWEAGICHNNRKIHLGLWLTEIEAARAYNAAAVELFGDFARLNEVAS